MTKDISLEDFVMAHRYLYYVEGTPTLSDSEYDRLESMALRLIPKESSLNSTGSDLAASYSDAVKAIAKKLKNQP